MSTRSTRGKRTVPLTAEEIAANEEFWGELLKDDKEADPDFEEVADSDDDEEISDEIEEEIESENEDDVKIDKAKEKKQPKKQTYKDPKLKRKQTDKLSKPSFLKAIEGEDVGQEGKEVEEEEGEEEVEKVVKKARRTPPTPPSPTTTRKSLRPSVQASIERSEAAQKALREQPKKTIKKKVVKEKQLTQQELLDEARKTEIINQNSLNNLLKKEEERRKSMIHTKKQVISGPRIIYSSSLKNGTNITFTDGYLPDCIDHQKQVEEKEKLKEIIELVNKTKKCVITGDPAKYIDPATKLPYSSISVRNQLSNVLTNINNNATTTTITTPPITSSSSTTSEKRPTKRKSIPVINTTTTSESRYDD